jgi:hypothetical protein
MSPLSPNPTRTGCSLSNTFVFNLGLLREYEHSDWTLRLRPLFDRANHASRLPQNRIFSFCQHSRTMTVSTLRLWRIDHIVPRIKCVLPERAVSPPPAPAPYPSMSCFMTDMEFDPVLSFSFSFPTTIAGSALMKDGFMAHTIHVPGVYAMKRALSPRGNPASLFASLPSRCSNGIAIIMTRFSQFWDYNTRIARACRHRRQGGAFIATSQDIYQTTENCSIPHAHIPKRSLCRLKHIN